MVRVLHFLTFALQYERLQTIPDLNDSSNSGANFFSETDNTRRLKFPKSNLGCSFHHHKRSSSIIVQYFQIQVLLP